MVSKARTLTMIAVTQTKLTLEGVRLMKKLGFAVILLLGFAGMAVAQDVPVAEVFGGYSFFRCDAGDDISCNLNGWNAAVDFNASDRWSVVADFSGHYGYLDGPVATPSGVYPWYDVKSHNFMFGPRYKMRTEKVTPFVHALFGINHINPEAGDTVQNNFAMAFGGGVDVKVSDKMSVRALQLDYVTARADSDWNDNLRFSAGVVFHLGSR